MKTSTDQVVRSQSFSGLLAVVGLSMLLLLGGCQADSEVLKEVPSVVGYPGVAEELWSYFSLFEEEARARGVPVDLREANITGKIDELKEHQVVGRCSYSFRQPNLVTIDETFWKQGSSNRSREFVVFHELGHCFLQRAHREDRDRLGLCLSIMRSGSGSCRDNYSSLTRARYLDELFDTSFAGDILK